MEKYSSTDEQVDEISLRIENKLTKKRRDKIKKSKNTILKALISPSVNSPNNSNVYYLSSDVAPNSENISFVRSTSHGFDSDQEKLGPDGSTADTQVPTHDTPLY